jgi:hypothetical protein
MYPFVFICIRMYPYVSVCIHMYPYVSVCIRLYPYVSVCICACLSVIVRVRLSVTLCVTMCAAIGGPYVHVCGRQVTVCMCHHVSFCNRMCLGFNVCVSLCQHVLRCVQQEVGNTEGLSISSSGRGLFQSEGGYGQVAFRAQPPRPRPSSQVLFLQVRVVPRELFLPRLSTPLPMPLSPSPLRHKQ